MHRNGRTEKALQPGLFYPVVELDILTGVKGLVHKPYPGENVPSISTAGADRANPSFLVRMDEGIGAVAQAGSPGQSDGPLHRGLIGDDERLRPAQEVGPGPFEAIGQILQQPVVIDTAVP